MMVCAIRCGIYHPFLVIGVVNMVAGDIGRFCGKIGVERIVGFIPGDGGSAVDRAIFIGAAAPMPINIANMGSIGRCGRLGAVLLIQLVVCGEAAGPLGNILNRLGSLRLRLGIRGGGSKLGGDRLGRI